MHCFHSIRADLSSCDRDHMTHKPKIFTFWSFEKKFADPALGWPHMFSSWQASWSGRPHLGWFISVLHGLIFQEAGLEFSIWWCQDSRKWQERASPNMQAFFKSLLVSHFSVVTLVKVSPLAKPRVYRGATQEPVLKKGIIAASSESSSSHQLTLPQLPLL